MDPRAHLRAVAADLVVVLSAPLLLAAFCYGPEGSARDFVTLIYAALDPDRVT